MSSAVEPILELQLSRLDRSVPKQTVQLATLPRANCENTHCTTGLEASVVRGVTSTIVFMRPGGGIASQIRTPYHLRNHKYAQIVSKTTDLEVR